MPIFLIFMIYVDFYRLEEEKQELDAQIESVEQKAEDNHSNRIAGFKKVVKPLEETRNSVIEEIGNVQTRISTTENKIQTLGQEIVDASEELEKAEQTKLGHIDVKVDLHKKMDEYKANYNDELQLFYEEEKNKEEIKDLKEKQKELKAKIKDSGAIREELKQEIIELNGKFENFNHMMKRILMNFQISHFPSKTNSILLIYFDN